MSYVGMRTAVPQIIHASAALIVMSVLKFKKHNKTMALIHVDFKTVCYR